MDHHVSDQDLISRLRSANDDARDHFSMTVTLILETQDLLRRAARIGSALISRQPDGPP